MSIEFKLSDFVDEEKVEIRKILTFTPEIDYQSSKMNQEKKPIKFLYSEGDTVYLPFYFGLQLKEKYKFPQFPSLSFSFLNPPREKQLGVVEEAMPILKRDNCVILGLHTAFGKTYLGLYLAQQLKNKIIMVHTLNFLGKSWLEALTKHTNCQNYLILEKIGNKLNLEKYIAEKKDYPDILFVGVQRIKWLSKEQLSNYGTLIIDEAHEFCSPMRSLELLKIQPQYILALTATLKRADGMFKMMKSLAGEVVLRKSERPFYIYKTNTNIKPFIDPDKKKRWNGIVKSLTESKQRNQLILDLIKENKDKKILILIERKNHVTLLSVLFASHNIEHATFYGKAKGYEDQRVVIGTFKKMSTGFDEENMVENFSGERFNLLILAMSVKDELKLEQSVGRVFRIEEPDVIDLVDDSPTTKRHWGKRKKWYGEYNGRILE